MALGEAFAEVHVHHVLGRADACQRALDQAAPRAGIAGSQDSSRAPVARPLARQLEREAVDALDADLGGLVSPDHLAYPDVLRCCENSLRRLGMAYVDLERWEEALVILVFHIVGTAMEVSVRAEPPSCPRSSFKVRCEAAPSTVATLSAACSSARWR